ncbi:hypothetical protein PF002_g29472 [Phytophthora fragariae]|uniref:Uncharacterized protein n=1 Tax=Phytophthora fragariae TaxID=53985 RepID=A0A6A3VY31_9STRA|nr:hypothetical protein PF002_g29472 [Phytophthora fragariae]
MNWWRGRLRAKQAASAAMTLTFRFAEHQASPPHPTCEPDAPPPSPVHRSSTADCPAT